MSFLGEVHYPGKHSIAGGTEPDKPMAVENEAGAHAGRLLISLIRSSRRI
jgi:hypothetical protein